MGNSVSVHRDHERLGHAVAEAIGDRDAGLKTSRNHVLVSRAHCESVGAGLGELAVLNSAVAPVDESGIVVRLQFRQCRVKLGDHASHFALTRPENE